MSGVAILLLTSLYLCVVAPWRHGGTEQSSKPLSLSVLRVSVVYFAFACYLDLLPLTSPARAHRPRARREARRPRPGGRRSTGRPASAAASGRVARPRWR